METQENLKSTEVETETKTAKPVESKSELKRRMKALCKLREEVQQEERELAEYQIHERMILLKSLYNRLMDKYDIVVRSQVSFNDGLLYAAVRSYYDDIYRFKNYSNSEWADSHKQAGYTIKWLAKFRPIQINLPQSPMPNVLFKLNATYAIFVGLTFLKSETEIKLSAEYLDHLIYTLTFRNLSGKQLSSLFYLLECNANGKQP